MAKYELPIYDLKSNEKIKEYKSNIIPMACYLEFQELCQNAVDKIIENDRQFFDEFSKVLFGIFPELTAEEFEKQTDPADVMAVYNQILTKGTNFIKSKN